MERTVTKMSGSRTGIRIDMASKRTASRAKGKISGKVKPWLFLLPTIVIIVFWMIKPLIQTLMYTLYDWNMLPGTVPEFVGLSNFKELFNAPEFGSAIVNTFYYILMMLPFSVILPMIIAALIQNVNPKMQRIYRALIFIPMIMPPVATATVFQWLLHQTNGLINHVLISVGLIDNGINFFMTEGLARLMIALITGWKMIGFATLMFSASIGNISPEYYEAAKMDGSRGIRRFIDITVPMLSPTMMLMIMMSILFASQWTFAYIDVMTQGGPYGTTTNIYYLIYKYAFGNSNVGVSAAASLVFLVVFGIIALLLQKLSSRLAFYDN